MTKKAKLSVEEKFKLARQGYNSGRYTSIEEAAKKNGISPATYYNYAKKDIPVFPIAKTPVEEQVEVQKSSGVVSRISVDEDLEKENIFLRGQIEKLKNKLVELVLVQSE